MTLLRHNKVIETVEINGEFIVERRIRHRCRRLTKRKWLYNYNRRQPNRRVEGRGRIDIMI